MADVKYLKYKSSDGRTIPAYVTIPKGKGPYPLIVIPHGGPFVSETVVWDTWSQLLASYGYMVIQPQYRGSMVMELIIILVPLLMVVKVAIKCKMIKMMVSNILIDNGLVDKDNVAMFGWSYGGYAALVAASIINFIMCCSRSSVAEISATVILSNFT